MREIKRERASSSKASKMRTDYSIIVVTGMTVSDKAFSSSRMFTYKDCVHRLLVIAADKVKNDWGTIVGCYRCLHMCACKVACSNLVIDIDCFGHDALCTGVV